MAKKRRKADGARAVKTADPLGGLIRCYQVNMSGLLLGAGVMALVGLSLVALALVWKAMSLILLGGGALILVTAAVVVGANMSNTGRRLELRKKGVRFVDSGEETDLFWEDVLQVQVDRTDETDMGWLTRETRGAHYMKLTGPMTQTTWEVTIIARGDAIYLDSRFLKLVPDVSKLISDLRMRAGVRH
jgi:hypothetical protein